MSVLKIRDQIHKLQNNFKISSRALNRDTAFAVVVLFLNDFVYGFNKIRNGVH